MSKGIAAPSLWRGRPFPYAKGQRHRIHFQPRDGVRHLAILGDDYPKGLMITPIRKGGGFLERKK